jgi:hypothetical protein
VRKAARLGVHMEAADRCWVSRTPSWARRSILGVLREKKIKMVVYDPIAPWSR